MLLSKNLSDEWNAVVRTCNGRDDKEENNMSATEFVFFYGNDDDYKKGFGVMRLLFDNEFLKELTIDAKVIYGLMLDTMTLSIKNDWHDEEQKRYIYFSIEKTMEVLNCSKNKAISVMKELEQNGLIERKKQGQGKPSVTYVKCFKVIKEESQKSEKSTSRSSENQPLEVEITNTNNILNYKQNYIESNHIYDDRDTEDYLEISEQIKKSIEIDVLYLYYPYDKELIDEIYQTILRVVMCKNKNIKISEKEVYPREFVRDSFLRLNFTHIQYVLDGIKSTTKEKTNLSNYLKTALFNSLSTKSFYYQSRLNHAMPELVKFN